MALKHIQELLALAGGLANTYRSPEIIRVLDIQKTSLENVHGILGVSAAWHQALVNVQSLFMFEEGSEENDHDYAVCAGVVMKLVQQRLEQLTALLN